MYDSRQFWLGLCRVVGVALLLAATASAADQEQVRKLLAQIEQIPMVDTHNHVPLPVHDAELLKQKGFRYDLTWLLGTTTYVAEFIHGKDWPEIKQTLDVNSHHAYYRPIRQALVDLYGLGPDEELTDANAGAVSAQLDAKRRDTANWFGEVYHRANVTHVLWLDAQPEVAVSANGAFDQLRNPGNRLPHTQYHPVWNVDTAIVFIATPLTDKEKKSGVASRIDQTEKRFAVKLRNLADMERFIERQITDFFHQGGVGLKSTAAYFRPLNFDTKVPRKEAESIFAEVVARKTPSAERRTRLEDYLMTRVLGTLSKLKKPIQFHTGNQQSWNLVAISNPLGLNQLLDNGEFSNVKFVILHGGYPYTQEAITMVRYYSNAYLDLAWMALFSPAAAKRSLGDAIDMLDGRQLMFGTDSANLEEMYGTVKVTRRLLAEVLAEKIESGFLTERTALQIARRILYTNGMELYGLQDSTEHASSRP